MTAAQPLLAPETAGTMPPGPPPPGAPQTPPASDPDDDANGNGSLYVCAKCGASDAARVGRGFTLSPRRWIVDGRCLPCRAIGPPAVPTPPRNKSLPGDLSIAATCRWPACRAYATGECARQEPCPTPPRAGATAPPML